MWGLWNQRAGPTLESLEGRLLPAGRDGTGMQLGQLSYPIHQETYLDFNLTLQTKITSRWIKGLKD